MAGYRKYGGPFNRRFLLASALRITGPVDLAVLQGALDDVVARQRHHSRMLDHHTLGPAGRPRRVNISMDQPSLAM
jgi:hypothetical protein